MTGNAAPLEIVEIDFDFCLNTYGLAPCTATGAVGDECFNRFRACQDPDNYSRGTQTLRFSKNQSTGIFGQVIFPALRNVSTTRRQIATSRVNDRLGSLGKRVRVTFDFQDFSWNGKQLDPYFATRNVEIPDTATFFSRLRAIDPYFYKRAIRYKIGRVGDDPDTMPAKHYIITEMRGPDASGRVSFVAHDPLKLADEDFALCPQATTGKLLTAIDETTTVVTLDPIGSGDAQYPTEGKVSIGSEIMDFTRVGDQMTFTSRGANGTTASTHSERDTVQLCYSVSAARPGDVLFDLLSNFSGVDPAFLPTTAWDLEFDTWRSGLRMTRVVPKPKSVKSLLEEFCDFGISIWWEDEQQEVQLRVTRPVDLGADLFVVSDDSAAVIEKSLEIEDLHRERVSRVIGAHAVLSYTSSLTDLNNYGKPEALVDPRAESADEYNQPRTLQLYFPWLGNLGNDVFTVNSMFRLLLRYRDTPQRVSFESAASQKNNLKLGSIVRLNTKVLQDEFGRPLDTVGQVIAVEEVAGGRRLKVEVDTVAYALVIGFITPNDYPTYDLASEQQKQEGAFIVDDTTLQFPDGRPPYRMV